MNRISALVLLVFLLCSPAFSQGPVDLLHKQWKAQWIVAQQTDPFSYGVYHFRKAIQLSSKPSKYSINVTADNRYQLYVNGELVVWGPARGDLNHWRYETVDISNYLHAGKNVLAAVVWNYGQYAPEAQVTWRTGFILQGSTVDEAEANTDKSWKAVRDEAFQPIYFSHGAMSGYYVAGPGDRVDGNKFPWGWEKPDFDDREWPGAELLTSDGRSGGHPRDAQDATNMWLLVPRSLPLMEMTPQRIPALRDASGVKPPDGFPNKAVSINIPAHTRARFLLDQTVLTTAFPELTVSGGKSAKLRLGYAESLFLPNAKGEKTGNNKGNRNEIAGKFFRGNYDEFTADGGEHRRFRPLWWRTWRYVELIVETGDAPLVLEDIAGTYTGYPMARKARFESESKFLDQVLEVGWRTARLDAHETFMDCPYYEQLQYAGDTRIQALISLYSAGDPRLVRNAISLINDSRTAEGATMSRAPTRQQQYIPPFSLWWIGMVHDYARYQDDPAFIRSMMPGVRAVLSFYSAHQLESGSLGKMPWWNFFDWTRQWSSGVPASGPRGESAEQDLLYLMAQTWAADLEDSFGSRVQAAELRENCRKLNRQIRSLYWDQDRKLYADTPEHKQFSQHANVLAVLADLSTGDEARDIVSRILNDTELVQCSYYFKHYLHTAVNKVGLGDRYVDLLSGWQDMLDRGLTTFAEQADPTRSDCHAWSASPNFEIFRTIVGIDSSSFGFKIVTIRPFPGKLGKVSGAIPHPKGEISVKYEVKNSGISAEVVLPPGVTGTFQWKGEASKLNSGRNALKLGQ